MITAVALGIVIGVVGFIPLIVGLRATKHVTRTSNLGHMGILMLALLVSVIILFGATIACAMLARDVLLPFGVAEGLALVVAAIVFGVRKVVMRK